MKILQIIPATGYSVQCQDKPKSKPYCLPLVAWALVEDEYGTRVTGIVLDNDGLLQPADEFGVMKYLKK